MEAEQVMEAEPGGSGVLSAENRRRSQLLLFYILHDKSLSTERGQERSNSIIGVVMSDSRTKILEYMLHSS